MAFEELQMKTHRRHHSARLNINGNTTQCIQSSAGRGQLI